MDTADLDAELETLNNVEDFLQYFQVEYDPIVVQPKRVPLLRLFHNILNTLPKPWAYNEYKKALNVAYRQLKNGNELAFEPSACQGCTECDD